MFLFSRFIALYLHSVAFCYTFALVTMKQTLLVTLYLTTKVGFKTIRCKRSLT